jgi:hypothetical protein
MSLGIRSRLAHVIRVPACVDFGEEGPDGLILEIHFRLGDPGGGKMT